MRLCEVFLLLPMFVGIQSANILGIFPHPSKSHHILGNALLKELVHRGHDVTMVSPYNLDKPPKNYHHVHLKSLLRKHEEVMKDMANNTNGMISNILWVLGSMTYASRGILSDGAMVDFLKTNPKFDVTILLTALTEPLLGIAHQVNSSVIGFSQIGVTPFVSNMMGNPNPIAYAPTLMLPYSDNMNFLERTVNTLVTVLIELFMHLHYMPNQANVLHEFFPNAPSLNNLMKNVHLTLVNSHFTSETPRPYLPSVIQIGGFHLEEKEELGLELEKFMNNSKHGVIYFSFGTNIKSKDLGESTIRDLLASFAKVKYDVLWKFEEDLQEITKNVKVLKWIPQKAVLRHPKTIAFITHGGLGSTVEAIYYGVPMIAVPFFGDQVKNVIDSVEKGIAIKIDKADLNGDRISEVIKEITKNPKYSNAIKLRSDLYRNQPMNPMERAVFWVEHVIKHKGAKHLQAKAVELSWYQYMLLDVIAFISFVITLLFCSIFYFIKMLCRCCIKKNNSIKNKND